MKFRKEFNEGKDPDSRIPRSKNYGCATKVLDFFDLHWVFCCFLDVSKENNRFLFSRFLVLENLENPKKPQCFWIFFF